MNPHSKRRRLNDSPTVAPIQPDAIANSLANESRCAIEMERRKWNGFCELESEPAIFNAMLRDFGVKGVKVQEVVSLDEEMLALLNKPVYGLIFLFRWREDDPDKQEASCPEGLWFANQTASNACASVALLNIVNNIEGLDLGENLQRFKDFTMPFTPALRGDAISNFEFVKRIHNSFARKMDMLNSDLQLKTEATSKRSRTGKIKYNDYEADAGFHFIAFVPALGKIWKFDGLERQPQALGAYNGTGHLLRAHHTLGEYTPEMDWLTLVRPNILTRMAAYEEGQIEFSILSVARDPLVEIEARLATNVRCLELVNQRLASLKTEEDPEIHTESSSAAAAVYLENTIIGPDASLNLTRDRIDSAIIPPDMERVYDHGSLEEIKQHQLQLSIEQQKLRTSIREEQQSHQLDEDYAAGRRFDYGPAIRTWLRLLARKKLIESLQ